MPNCYGPTGATAKSARIGLPFQGIQKIASKGPACVGAEARFKELDQCGIPLLGK